VCFERKCVLVDNAHGWRRDDSVMQVFDRLDAAHLECDQHASTLAHVLGRPRQQAANRQQWCETELALDAGGHGWVNTDEEVKTVGLGLHKGVENCGFQRARREAQCGLKERAGDAVELRRKSGELRGHHLQRRVVRLQHHQRVFATHRLLSREVRRGGPQREDQPKRLAPREARVPHFSGHRYDHPLPLLIG